MILKDVFDQCSYDDVMLELLELFPDEITNEMGYLLALYEIEGTAPLASDKRLDLKWYTDEFDGEPYLNANCLRGDEVMGYSMMGMPWGETLGVEIPPLMLDQFKLVTICAMCLYEMTFMGYSDEEVQKKMDAIVGMKDDYLARHGDES